MKRKVKASRYRFERKYYIDNYTADLLQKRLEQFLQPDKNAGPEGYVVSSCYFDNNYSESFVQKQNGVLERNKYRIRYYDKKLDTIHLERKHKHGEMICKHQMELNQNQFEEILAGATRQTELEKCPLWLDFYSQCNMAGMRPVLYIDYERRAFTYRPGNVRVTFDSNLMVSRHKNPVPVRMLNDSICVLEIKYDHFLPSLISELLAGMPLTQVAISKYVMGVSVLENKIFLPV